MAGKKIKVKKMGIFVSTLRHNSDKKNVMENKIQNNVRQYKIGEFLCNITKYNRKNWIIYTHLSLLIPYVMPIFV
jgi:hypothetical protein